MNIQRQYVFDTLNLYWKTNQYLIEELPIIEINHLASETLPPETKEIILPDWASDVGIYGKILVPVQYTQGDDWNKVDWIHTAFWFSNGLAERAFEEKKGSIHSYSYRLTGWNEDLWNYAWVNRIALFLRKWAAYENNKNDNDLFGKIPKASIMLTHDVDAIEKTLAIRLKQTTFHFFNSVRALLRFDLKSALNKLQKAILFFFSNDNYWCFDQICTIENEYNVRSIFNIYGGIGGGKRTLKEKLFDPSYSIQINQKFQRTLTQLRSDGWEIGLHEAYDSWQDKNKIMAEKVRVEKYSGGTVNSCRQHWLRFSWKNTWEAQEKCEIEKDFTLGFNDRQSFRNGLALPFHPWDFEKNCPRKIKSVPMLLMDSHFFDYSNYTESDRNSVMSQWIDKVVDVGGTVSVIWHQRVFSKDYNWGDAYERLLRLIKEKKIDKKNIT